MAYHLFRIALIALFIVLWPAGPANAIEECCNIVAIDEATGIVTAVNRNSGRTFDFTVKNEALLNALRPEMVIGLASVPGSNVLSITGVAGVNKLEWPPLVDGLDDCCDLVGSEQFSKVKPAAGKTPQPEKSMIGPRRTLIESGIVAGIDLAPGVRLEITNLQRVGPNLVTMTYTITNGTNEIFDVGSSKIADFDGTFNGVGLLDYENGNVHPVVKDADGLCRCSRGSKRIPAGASQSFWAEFAAPPADVDKIGISFTNAPPIYGVPISNQ